MTEPSPHAHCAFLARYPLRHRGTLPPAPSCCPSTPTRPTTRKAPAPLQAGNTTWFEADNGFSEDCLNLNVWAPEDVADEPLPVIVYIYGGGFEMGANTQTTSNASGLAATGRAVGVSLNYRLGPFGWLSLSHYGGALEDATNLAIQDIITALRWVERTSPASAATRTMSPSPVTAPAPTRRPRSLQHPQQTAFTTTSPHSPVEHPASSQPGGRKNSPSRSSPNSEFRTTPNRSSLSTPSISLTPSSR